MSLVLLSMVFMCCQSSSSSQERINNLGDPPTEDLKPSADFDLQGHRGARGLLPENSIPGFIKAVALGVKTLELDVVVSKDGKMIVSHEPFFSHQICQTPTGDSISEAAEKNYNIYQYTAEAIQQFDCGSLGNANFPEQKAQAVYKPTLLEVIDTVEKYIQANNLEPVYYNIETKSTPEGDSLYHPAPTQFAEMLYAELKSTPIIERVYIQSFDVRTLQVFKKLDKDIPLVLLVANNLSLEQNLEKLGFTPKVYSPYYELVDKKLMKEAKAKKMLVIPWTVNEREKMQEMLNLGVDGLITDYPNRFLELTKS